MRLTLALLALQLGCEGKEAPPEISDEPLAGSFGGEAWSFVAGDVDAYMTEDGVMVAQLWPESFEACTLTSHAATRWLVVQIPEEPGEHALDGALNGTFVQVEGEQTENVPALDGVVRVDSLDQSTLAGGLAMRDASGAYEVSGTFELELCEP